MTSSPTLALSQLNAGPDVAEKLTNPATRSALVVAHPAHELRVFQWMQLSKPCTYILTSGSRSGGDRTRLAASAQGIGETGAEYIAAWGGMRDTALYNQLLAGDADEIVARTRTLAHDLAEREVELIVTDSWQLYNVAHDLTHVMARSAAELASRRLAHPIRVVDYPVVPRRMAPGFGLGAPILTMRLSRQRIAEKDAAIRKIPMIEQEVADLTHAEGADLLAREDFHAPHPLAHLLASLASSSASKPYYERYGEERKRAGVYAEVVRAAHVEAFVRALLALL